MSLKKKILESDDIGSELVEIPEWDVIVEVRGMTGYDRAKVYENANKKDGMSMSTFYVETVVATTYDPDTNERIFGEEDKEALLQKSAAAIDRLASVGMRLSAMDTEAVDESKKSFPENPVS